MHGDSIEKKEEMIGILDRARAGDQHAFSLLYHEYYTPIYRYIYFRVKNREEAEDLVQTVFLKVYATLPSMQGDTISPRAFFFTVARNSIIDFYRKQSYRRHSGEEAYADTPDEAPQPNERAEQNEEAAWLKTVVERLPKDQSEVIINKFMNNLETKEIAELMGKREDAIRQIQSRAIKALRKILEEEKRI